MPRFAAMFIALFILPRAISADPWTFIKSQEGIHVYARRVKGFRQKQFRSTARINHPVVRVLAVLQDIERYPEFIPSYERMSIFKRIAGKDETIFHVYGVFKGPFVSRRDTVLSIRAKFRRSDDEPGKITGAVIMMKNIKHPQYPKKEHIRLPYFRGLMRLKSIADGRSTNITSVMHVVPGGWIPAGLLNFIGSYDAIETIRAIRKRCDWLASH